MGIPSDGLSGKKIKWLEAQKWVRLVSEAKNTSKAGSSREHGEAAAAQLRRLLVATCFYYRKILTPARNTSLWNKFSSSLALCPLEANTEMRKYRKCGQGNFHVQKYAKSHYPFNVAFPEFSWVIPFAIWTFFKAAERS